MPDGSTHARQGNVLWRQDETEGWQPVGPVLAALAIADPAGVCGIRGGQWCYYGTKGLEPLWPIPKPEKPLARWRRKIAQAIGFS